MRYIYPAEVDVPNFGGRTPGKIDPAVLQFCSDKGTVGTPGWRSICGKQANPDTGKVPYIHFGPTPSTRSMVISEIPDECSFNTYIGKANTIEVQTGARIWIPGVIPHVVCNGNGTQLDTPPRDIEYYSMGLPSGLKMSKRTADIRGKLAAGPGPYCVKVAAMWNNSVHVFEAFQIFVKPGVPIPGAPTRMAEVGMVQYLVTKGRQYDGPITKVAGDQALLRFHCQKPCQLPAGLKVDPADGRISGVATELGAAKVTVVVMRGNSITSDETVVATVNIKVVEPSGALMVDPPRAPVLGRAVTGGKVNLPAGDSNPRSSRNRWEYWSSRDGWQWVSTMPREDDSQAMPIMRHCLRTAPTWERIECVVQQLCELPAHLNWTAIAIGIDQFRPLAASSFVAAHEARALLSSDKFIEPQRKTPQFRFVLHCDNHKLCGESSTWLLNQDTGDVYGKPLIEGVATLAVLYLTEHDGVLQQLEVRYLRLKAISEVEERAKAIEQFYVDDEYLPGLHTTLASITSQEYSTCAKVSVGPILKQSRKETFKTFLSTRDFNSGIRDSRDIWYAVHMCNVTSEENRAVVRNSNLKTHVLGGCEGGSIVPMVDEEGKEATMLLVNTGTTEMMVQVAQPGMYSFHVHACARRYICSVARFELVFKRGDECEVTNGPGGKPCARESKIEDLVKFDGKYTCNCTKAQKGGL